jgi:hypothetical protein
MERHLNEQTIQAYRNGLETDTAQPPQIDSVWYDDVHDDYILPTELASLMLNKFASGRSSPWALAYALKFGNQAEKEAAKTSFYEWRFGPGAQADDPGEWLSLVRFFVGDDPSLHSLFHYRQGSLLSLAFQSDTQGYWEDCVSVRLPQAMNDLRDYVEEALPHLRNSPERLNDLCEILIPFGKEAAAVMGESVMQTLADITFESWHSMRYALHDEDILPAFVSWDRLKWCWTFGWHEVSRRLCEVETFVGDCLEPYKSSKTHLPLGVQVAQNLGALSLLPEKLILEKLSPRDLIQEHLQTEIHYISRNFPGDRRNALHVMESMTWGDVFPTDTGGPDEMARQLAPEMQDMERALILSVHHSLRNIWKLRLALAIARRRLHSKN